MASAPLIRVEQTASNHFAQIDPIAASLPVRLLDVSWLHGITAEEKEL